MDGIELDPSLPLSALSYKFRTLVSNLLNTKRVLTTDGPTPLLRDWRGLACLLQISSELAASIGEIQDKTGRLLEIWTQKGDGTATLGTLLQYLIKLDRYDVHDDIIDLAKQGQLLAPGPNQDGSGKEVVPVKEDKNDSMILTHDDRRDGVPNFYHAYVLFAQEDWSFVRELLARMRASGFKLCTEYDIDVGYATQYAPVAQLILERCYRIILVYSPAFIDSPANTFYSDYAQAVGIESNKRNIIPIIYRDCKLPHNLMYYHRLVYKPQEWAPYDFWKKLAQTLEQVKLPTSNGALPSTDTTSTTVTELESSYADAFLNTSAFDTYSTGDTPQVEISQLKDSSSTDSSQASSEKKKTRSVTKVFRFLRGKTKVYG